MAEEITIMIPYSIKRVSKTQFQGTIKYPGETFVFEPTTKGRCTNRLCDRLQPLLLKQLEATWPDDFDKPLTDKDIEEPDVPETTAAARERQLESLPPEPGLHPGPGTTPALPPPPPPDTGAMDEAASRRFPPPHHHHCHLTNDHK